MAGHFFRRCTAEAGTCSFLTMSRSAPRVLGRRLARNPNTSGLILKAGRRKIFVLGCAAAGGRHSRRRPPMPFRLLFLMATQR